MIKLEAYVDDKKIAAVLHALDGLIVQMSVGPVHNVKAKATKIKEAGNPTTGPEAIVSAMRAATTAGQDTVSLKGIIEHAKTYGVGAKAINSAMNNATHKNHWLKRRGKGVYLINKAALGE